MTLQDRLRDTVEKLRRTPMPIADIIPLLQQAADELDKKDKRLEWLDCLDAAGVDNWEGIEEAIRIRKEWNGEEDE